MQEKLWIARSGSRTAEALDTVHVKHSAERANQSPFLSLTLDESTTNAGEQHMSVHVHYCSSDFTRKSVLAALAVIDGRPNADKITEVLLSNVTAFLKCKQHQLAPKLVCIATYGCEVMMGKHNGVHTQVQRKCGPFAVGVHDFTNREGLSSATLEKCMLLQRVQDDLCTPAYKVFHNSGPSRWELRQCQQMAGWSVQRWEWFPSTM